MKLSVIFLFVICITESGCGGYESADEAAANDTIPPIIEIDGRLNDTAYRYASYWEKGAHALEQQEGELRSLCIDVEKSGTLNTDVTGTYFLYYNASDEAGNHAATVTRTVHVVENSAAFLNGLYNVACSRTTAIGSGFPVITTDNYVAAITTGTSNGRFNLNVLKGDPANQVPLIYLAGNSITLKYSSYQNTIGSGTLSAAKNSFTIETESLQSDTVTVKYRCKNVFVKP